MLRFHASEIVDMAVQIEKNGYAFYSALIEKEQQGDKRLLEVWQDLAAQELQHIKDFTALLEGVKRYEPAETYAGEHQDYLSAMADMHVFVKEGAGARLAEQTKDPVAALDAAISFERDSVLFYYEIREMVAERDKAVVNEVIRQEKMHLVRLTNIKREIA